MTMRTKYRSKKVTVDGITFDSRREAQRWQELNQMLQAGEISDLRRQVRYTLIPNQYIGEGKLRKLVERKCEYLADFVYQRGSLTIVEDVKGYRTPDYIIKRKLMLYIHGIQVQEVK